MYGSRTMVSVSGFPAIGGVTRVRILSLGVLSCSLSLALAGPLQSQELAGPVVLALEPGADALVPIDLGLARRPGELRLDPVSGAISGPPAPGVQAFLAFDPATGALLAVDLSPIARAGRVRLHPRTGAATPEGVGRPAAPPGPVLVGLDPATGALATVELAATRAPGTFIMDPRSGTLSPSPDESALLGFDLSGGGLVPVFLSPVRGRGLSIDRSTGRLSATAETGSGPVHLLGIRSDGAAIVAVDVDFVHQPGILAIDPGTGLLVAGGEAPDADLTPLGIQSPTGALTRVDLRATPRPGQYAIDLSTGTAEPIAAPALESEPVRSGFLFGGGLEVRQMLKLADVLEEVSPGATDATKIAPGIHAFAEYAWRMISIGAEGGYSVMETEVTFPQGLQTGDLTYFEIGGSVKVRIPVEGPLTPYAVFAILRASIEGDFEIEGLTESRTHETKRDGIGAGFDYWATPNWGVRGEAMYNTTFEDQDAADHIRLHLGVVYSPEGTGRDED